MIKRIFDVVLSSVLLALLGPLLLVVAVAVKCDSKGPIFYRGKRVGRFGKPFYILKFRSMVDKAEKLGPDTTCIEDNRITILGSFLRKYKIDEIPQLINIFIGEMSFVGPRPQVQWAVDTYSQEEKAVLDLRPGITDWASIKFNYEEEIIHNSGFADVDEAYMLIIHPGKMRLQLKYLKERSFTVDLRIIFTTIKTVFETRIFDPKKKINKKVEG